MSSLRSDHPVRPMRRKAFTLVELLVVISIIAVLLAILMPALSGARYYVRGVRCATNLRELINATLMYAVNYDGTLPMPNWASQDPARGWLYKPPINYFPRHRHTGSLWQFLDNDSIYRCPVHEGPYRLSERLTSYLMNGAISGFGRADWSFEVSMYRPDGIVFWEAGETGWNDGSSFPWEGLTRRHGDGATVAAIDGHTEWMTHGEYNEALYTNGTSPLWCAPDREDGH